jgi:hypothetical protein
MGNGRNAPPEWTSFCFWQPKSRTPPECLRDLGPLQFDSVGANLRKVEVESGAGFSLWILALAISNPTG